MDGWRLAVGTFTAIPVRAPERIDRRVARTAMMLAPLAAVPLGVLAGVAFWVGSALGLGTFAAAVLAIAAVRLGDRGFHLDGLADTADGLAASYDRDRALAVMRTGDTGPAGVSALVLVLLAQVAGLAAIGDRATGAVAVGIVIVIVLSRALLVVACLRGIPAARPSGLGAVVAGTVPPTAAVVHLVVVAAVTAGLLGAIGRPWWSGPAALAAAVVVTAVIVRRCVRRLGGVTGDVLGAVVEAGVATAALVSAVA